MGSPVALAQEPNQETDSRSGYYVVVITSEPRSELGRAQFGGSFRSGSLRTSRIRCQTSNE